ncbi:MAG: DUF4129 domain-containing protein [Bacteroidetes bacterium]|nr:DUF4129 domain-containing protein [Bacteroidota bacterium]
MKKIIFLLLFLFAGTGISFAQAEKHKMKFDSSAVKPRSPSASTKDDYVKDDFYKYDTKDKADREEPNVFDRMWNSFWERLFDNMRDVDPKRGPNPWSILWILILVTLIVLVVLKVTNSGVNTIFAGKRKNMEHADASMEDVDIHAINYEQVIAEARAKKDFRLAVRLWFLRTLKELTDRELVAWKTDKTNSDYYYELSGNVLQNEFGDVSYVYDHIWYGDFPVDENSYGDAEDKFRIFHSHIDSSK